MVSVVDKKLFDLIVSLRLGEKRIKRLISSSKKEERQIYDEMVKALLDGDKDTAREYAREIVKIRKYRNSLQRYWSRIRELRLDLEKASVAKELKSSMVEAAKRISKVMEQLEELNLEEATKMLSTSKEYFEEIAEIMPNVDLDEEEKEEIEEILKIAETEGIEKIKEMFPTVEDIEEEKEALSEEE